MSLVIFIFIGLIVGIIARALVPGRDPGTGIVLLIGTIAQVVAWALLRATPLARYGQPWSFFASITVAAVLLSFYNAIAPSRPADLPATAVADHDGLPPPLPPPPARRVGAPAP